MTTLADVATRAGVSVAVVSRVLAADPKLRIRPDTRARVMTAAQELQYVPNHAGRALRLARARALAFVVPDIANPVFSDMIRGVEDEAERNGYSVLLGRAEWFSEHAGALQRLLGEGRVDGFLFQRADGTDDAALARILDGRQATILLNTAHPDLRGSVTFDEVAASQLATRHLISLGHQRIAHLGGLPTSDTAERRLRGFKLAMRAAGLSCPPASIVRAGYRPESGSEGLFTLIANYRPTAVFVANVNAAVGALTAARAAGVHVPGDLSIVALHDTWLAAHTQPPLTTVTAPLYEVGREGVRLLIERLEGNEPRDVVVDTPPSTLVVRGSTAPPRAMERRTGSRKSVASTR